MGFVRVFFVEDGVGAVDGLAAVFGQFVAVVCVCPGCGWVHCEVSASFFAFVVAGEVGFVTLGAVCALRPRGATNRAAAAIPAIKSVFLMEPHLPYAYGK